MSSFEDASPVVGHRAVPTFPKITRRPSIYKLFDAPPEKKETNNIIDLQTLNTMIKELDSKKFGIKKKAKKKPKPIEIKRLSTKAVPIVPTLPSIRSLENSDFFTIRTQKDHPTTVNNSKRSIENSFESLGIMKDSFEIDSYYDKFQNGIYGEKMKMINPNYPTYDSNNKEERYYHEGITEYLDVKCKFIPRNYKKQHMRMREMKKIEFKLIEDAQAKLIKKKTKKKRKSSNEELSPNAIKNVHYDKICDEILNTQKTVFTLTKKNEFTDLIINKYIKENFPNFEQSKSKNMRRIFIIKNSTVVTNTKSIIGIIAKIPTTTSLEKYNNHKRQIIQKNFLLYCQEKFHSQIKFEYLYSNDGKVINDLIEIKPTQKYIFVCPTSLFQGLSLSLNINIIKLYKTYFPPEPVSNGAFTDSSCEDLKEDESDEIQEDVFKLFFGKSNINRNYRKRAIKYKKVPINNSFTEGVLNEKSKEDYLYYSDNEERKAEAFGKITKPNKQKKIDYYIQSENSIYSEKITNLLSRLSTNTSNSAFSSIETSAQEAKDIQLTRDFLKEQKIKEKVMLKSSKVHKAFTTQDLIDSLKILKQKDPSINISKFYKHKEIEKKIPPKVKKNIDDNTNKYVLNENKTNKEFPHLLCYNIPLILSKHPKYSRRELINLFSLFKILVNIWLNIHDKANVDQYGIDFDIFHNCLQDISQEEEILARKIFDEINTGISGMLGLEDFVDALTILNRRELKDQMEFFLNVFDSKNKGEFTFEEVKTISKMSIKRLIKNYKNTPADIDIVKEIATFFAEYIYRICGCNIKKGLPIIKLKNIIESNSKELEYLEVFCCTYKSG